MKGISHTIKKAILICTVVFCMVSVSACNTIHGLGKDIESVGHAMKKSADK